jgi:carbon-monoxide dehydrogenase small subunit
LKKLVTVTVNGVTHELAVEPRKTLLEVVREDLGLTGSKKGCGIGDGVATFSCLMLAIQADGCVVETVESLAENGKLDKLQQSFVEVGAIQCGYCTPGMLMSATELLRRNPHPSEKEIRLSLSGNLCRCTGYQKIVEAIKAVAGE